MANEKDKDKDKVKLDKDANYIFDTPEHDTVLSGTNGDVDYFVFDVTYGQQDGGHYNYVYNFESDKDKIILTNLSSDAGIFISEAYWSDGFGNEHGDFVEILSPVQFFLGVSGPGIEQNEWETGVPDGFDQSDILRFTSDPFAI